MEKTVRKTPVVVVSQKSGLTGLIVRMMEAKDRAAEKFKDRMQARAALREFIGDDSRRWYSPHFSRHHRKRFGPGMTSRMRRAKEGKKPW